LCYNAKKYLNILCFILPIDDKYVDTRGFSEDYLAISARSDTTLSKGSGFVTDTPFTKYRVPLAYKLWQLGAMSTQSAEVMKVPLQVPVMFFVNTQADITRFSWI